MLEVALCSLFTILPDYLFRRYWQRRTAHHDVLDLVRAAVGAHRPA